MKDKLIQLSEKLGEPELTKEVTQKFSQFIKDGTGDTARQLARFLESVIKENSKLAGVLKSINQSIIATPFIILKRAFPQHMQFEDVSGTWKIIVNITPGEEVAVIHKVKFLDVSLIKIGFNFDVQKKGISKSNVREGGFEFTWDLIMRFDWKLQQLKAAELEITSISFDSNMSEANKKELQSVVDHFKS